MRPGYHGRTWMGQMDTMKIARACSSLLVVAVLAVATGITMAAPAGAQDAEVALRLEAQTPWTTLQRPKLSLSVRAVNLSAVPLDDLSIGVALGTAVRARNEYETMLSDGPPVIVFAPAPTAIDGVLLPGAERTVRVRVDLTGAISSDDSLVYPAEVTLFARDRPVTSFTTPVIHLVREPQVPIAFTWWAQLASGPVLDPVGHLTDPAFEAAIAPGGRLDAIVEALGTVAGLGISIEVVIEPLLLEQLTVMADGYRSAEGRTVEPGTGGAAAAADLLSRLRTTLSDPAISPVALPFAAPELPAMLRSGLVDHLERQYDLGRDRVRSVLGRAGELGVTAAPAGALDEAGLSFFSERGGAVVLADPGAVTRPEQANFFAPPPTARVPLADGDEITLILPDPSTQALFQRPDLRADPIRLAQAVLGELAVIWREQPVPIPPTVRGLALSLPEDIPVRAWGPLVRRLTQAPFLAPMPASSLVTTVQPQGGLAGLLEPSLASFTDLYARDLRTAGGGIQALAWTSVTGDGGDELWTQLAVAEAGAFVGDETSGRTWLRSVTDHTLARFGLLAPLPDQVFTLTSTKGTIPISFGQPLEPRRVVVELQSSWFRFPEGSTREVTLGTASRPLPFTVEATSSGRRTIRVLVRAGPGGTVIAERDVVVGSTAANRVALFITGAAALGLVALWARRLLPRTKR